jgi:alpha-galactosidase
VTQQHSELAAEFLELWGRWSASFGNAASLQEHADVDEEFRSFARDHADALAAEIERLQPIEKATGED